MNSESPYFRLPIYGPENAIYLGEAGPHDHSGGAGLEFSWEYRAGPGVGAENREVTVGVNAYIPDYKAGRTAGSDGRVDYEVVDKELDPKKYYRDFTNRMSDSDIRAQFNPFVQENLPPKIRNLKIDTYFEYASVVIDLSIIFGEFGKVTVDVPIPTHIWMTVEGDVIDASGVQGVLIYVSSNGWIDFDFSAMNWVTGNGEQVFHFKNTHHSLDIPWDVYIAGKCTVEITAVDMVGNRVSMEEQWFGVIQSVVNKFMDLMRGVWNKAVSLAMKLAMFIYEKIIKDLKEKIEDKIDSILEPAKKKAEDYIMKIFFALAVLYWEYETSDSMSENAGESISEILFGDFLKTIDPLLKLLNWIGSLVSPFLKIIEGLQKIVVDFVVDLIFPSNSGIVNLLGDIDPTPEAVLSALLDIMGIETATSRADGPNARQLGLYVFIGLIICKALKYVRETEKINDPSGIMTASLAIWAGFFSSLWVWTCKNVFAWICRMKNANKGKYSDIPNIFPISWFVENAEYIFYSGLIFNSIIAGYGLAQGFIGLMRANTPVVKILATIGIVASGFSLLWGISSMIAGP